MKSKSIILAAKTEKEIPSTEYMIEYSRENRDAYITCNVGMTHKSYMWDDETTTWKELPQWFNDTENDATLGNSDRTASEMGSVTSLGSGKTKYPTDYDPSVLQTFKNKHPENEYIVTFDAVEFTSLCPITSQPDFAKIIISYIPNEDMVESKSLKLYLFSFRNHGSFHEDCVNTIMKDLVKLMNPKYLEVKGIFAKRGGIAIYPFSSYADEEHKQLEADRKLQILSEASTRAVGYDM